MDRAHLLELLCEGKPIRALAHETGIAAKVLLKLRADAGRAATWYQDRVLRQLEATRLRIGAEQSFAATPSRKPSAAPEKGLRAEAIWIWLAVDPETGLTVAWLFAEHDAASARLLIRDAAARVLAPVKLVAEGNHLILAATEDPDGDAMDETIIARFIGTPGTGDPESAAAEIHPYLRYRQSPRLAASLRGRIEAQAADLALHALYRNFVTPRPGSDKTPAMLAGITSKPWQAKNLVDVLELWQELKTGPWYERVTVISSSPKAGDSEAPAAAPPPKRAPKAPSPAAAPGGNPFDALIGLKLTIVRRAADMLILHFGEVRRHGADRGTVGAYALHVQCPWRFAGSDGVVTGRGDLWTYTGPPPRPEQWSYEAGGSLQDRVLDHFIGGYDASTASWFNERNRFIVTDTRLTMHGDIRLRMLRDGCEFSVFPDSSVAAGECWRFFVPGNDAEPLVFPPPHEK